MTNPTEEIKKIEKELENEEIEKGGWNDWNNKEVMNAKLQILKLWEQREKKILEMIDDFKKSIMRNGNLSNRIIETEKDEFEYRHDYILNNIVIEYIEELKSKLKGEK